MVAVDPDGLGVVGIAGAAEEERVLPVAEDEEIGEPVLQVLGLDAGRGRRQDGYCQQERAHEDSGRPALGWADRLFTTRLMFGDNPGLRNEADDSASSRFARPGRSPRLTPASAGVWCRNAPPRISREYRRGPGTSAVAAPEPVASL